MNISVVIPTYNSAKNLRKCIKSVQWADEIILVDMQSTDKTTEIGKKFRTKIFERLPKNGNFDLNRKFGMEQAKGEWILKLDSDEVLSEKLQMEIQKLLKKRSVRESGFNLYNRIFMFGQQVKHGPVKLNSHELRLFRKSKWNYNPYRYHQQITVSGPTGFLNGYYDHYNFDTIRSFLVKTNKYTSLDAKHYLKEINGKTAILAPIKSFFKLFFFQLGFLDGKLGIATCLLYSIYNLIEKVKIWEEQQL